MKFPLLLLLASLLPAQTLTLTGPATAKQGTSVILTLSLSGGSGIAALQWVLSMPGGVTAALPASLVADKAVACGSANTACIQSGMNSTEIPGGGVAQLVVMLPHGVTGNASFAVIPLFAASSGDRASIVPVSKGPLYVLKVKH